jgi:hypothetical protein
MITAEDSNPTLENEHWGCDFWKQAQSKSKGTSPQDPLPPLPTKRGSFLGVSCPMLGSVNFNHAQNDFNHPREIDARMIHPIQKK